MPLSDKTLQNMPDGNKYVVSMQHHILGQLVHRLYPRLSLGGDLVGIYDLVTWRPVERTVDDSTIIASIVSGKHTIDGSKDAKSYLKRLYDNMEDLQTTIRKETDNK